MIADSGGILLPVLDVETLPTGLVQSVRILLLDTLIAQSVSLKIARKICLAGEFVQRSVTDLLVKDLET